MQTIEKIKREIKTKFLILLGCSLINLWLFFSNDSSLGFILTSFPTIISAIMVYGIWGDFKGIKTYKAQLQNHTENEEKRNIKAAI